MIRVFIVAASPLVRAGLEARLRGRVAIEIIGSAADWNSPAELLSEAEPDVLLLDASGEDDGTFLDALAASDVASDTHVIVLTSEAQPGGIAAALRAGARAVLPHDVSPEQLITAIEAVATGLVVIHPAEVTAVVSNSVRTPVRTELLEELTPREREVLQMLAGGLGNKEIAARLSISEHTAKFHVASILGKLGASTRTEAVSIGIRHGLILL